MVVLVYLSFYGGQGLLFDCDTGYHIRIGDFIIHTLTIPKYDILSFIPSSLPWINHEWLSEVIMSCIHGYFGLTGIVIFFAFIIALTYSFFFNVMKSYQNNMLISAFLMSLVIGTTSIHWFARPYIFSTFFIVIWYYLLDLYHYRGKNYLFLLPLIMFIWVNLHGGSIIIAFLLNGVYIFGNFANLITAKKIDKVLWINKIIFLGVITIICLLISLINPYGYHILSLPFHLVSTTFIPDNIYEFLSPNFHESMPFTYLLFFMIIIFSISKRSLNVIELSLIVLFTYMALHSRRFVPLFGIVAAPIILRQADTLISDSKGKVFEFLKVRSKNIAAIDNAARGHIWPIATFLFVVILSLNGRIAYSFDSRLKPADAAEFLKSEKLTGNVFNEREFGDYIIYALWPQYKVFICAEVYSEERFKEYFDVVRIQPGWNEVLNKYKINWIIHNTNSMLSIFLLEREDWKIIYIDKVASIFVRNTPDNQYIINKYAYVEETAKNNMSITK